MYLYVAETKNVEDGHTVSIKHEIDADEVALLNSAFAVTSVYHAITQIKNIVIENGIAFKKWMSPENLEQNRPKGVEPSRMIMLANRSVLNYASSTKTFIDMENTLLANRKPEAVALFQDLTHQFYDKYLEYRFWANFRNYIVHCSFPYTTFSARIGHPCELRCTREHLLLFNNWKHSKADIEKMPEIVDLPSMIDPMSSYIMAFYLSFFTYFGSDIIRCIDVYGEFCRRHDVAQPIILHYEKVDDFGDGKMQPLPVDELNKMFTLLQNNPNVNINIT